MLRKSYHLISFLILFKFVLSNKLPNRVQVTVSQGILEGVVWQSDNGFLYNSFLSIPFAKPPLGNLRFRDPVPAEDWEGVKDATALAPICLQMEGENYIGSEDCLYLNVYVPSNNNNNTRYPVMFWVHGGAYTYGSGNPSDYFPNHLVEKNVIVVTMNYRLSALGFLSLQNEDVPGNAGAKDQVLALKWVVDNVAYFGGDPDSVTIFGESAGGASVHYLLMSPLAKGLFARAIIQSGVSINEWPLQDNPIDIAIHLGNLCGINTNDTNNLLKHLENVSPKDLLENANKIQFNGALVIGFVPVIETIFSQKPFITENSLTVMENGNFNKVPTMSGYVSNEGLIFFNDIDISNASKLNYVVPDFQKFIPRKLKHLTSEQKDLIAKRIEEYYFDKNDILEGFINLNSDFYFVKDIDKSTKILAKHIPNTYYYKFSYHGLLNLAQYVYITNYNYTGAAHADELSYLFDSDAIKHFEIKPTEKDKLVRKRMVELWTNFAKYGNPTPTLSENINMIWKSVEENQVNCLDIDEELTLLTNPFEERIQFWKTLEDDFFNLNS